MIDETPDLPDAEDALAAEYVLGLLNDEEARAFEAQLVRDPDLRQDVAAWAEYFSTFTDNIADETPPAHLWRRIEADAFDDTEKRPVWRQLLPYLLGAVAGAAVSWVVFTSDMLTPSQPELRADLAPLVSDLAFAARFDPQSGVLAVDLVAGQAPEGRVLELWLIADAASAPISLGLLSAETNGTVLALPPLLAERLPGATLAVSDEPPGGSPTGAPTGDVQAAGDLT